MVRYVSLFLALFTATHVSAQVFPRLELKLDKAAGGPSGELRLTWSDECKAPATDYAVYEGMLGNYPSHTSAICTTGGAESTLVTPSPDAAYYLVVPLESGTEDSYGLDGEGNQRAVGLQTCLPQQVVKTCVDDDFVDASPERLARLDAVLAQAASLFRSGASYTDIADMLALEPDVDRIHANGISLFFRVGGLPTVMYDGAIGRHGAPSREVIPLSGGSATPPAVDRTSSILLPAASVEVVLPRGQRMVGEDDDGDGRRDLSKHARLLSPYAFDFTTNDATLSVEAILGSVRDYQEGSVIRKDNPNSLIENSLHLDDYLVGWEDLDIIHISSHGDAEPDAVWGPDPYIFLGIGGLTCTEIAATIKAQQPDPQIRGGLYCGIPMDVTAGPDPIEGYDTFAARRFWEFNHGGKLHKKVIFMDSCRTAIHPGMSEALTGEDSIFLGWSESVFDGKSKEVAEALFTDSAVDGFPMLRSFVRECDTGQCIDPATEEDPEAELLAAWDRADLRIREGLTVTGTPTTGFCGVSSMLPIEQTCPSCGGGAALPVSFGIVVEGVRPEEILFFQDPMEFAFYQLRLFADVDRMESGFALPLTDLTTIPIDDGVYVDAPPGVILGINDACPLEVFEYEPWILLPAFDESLPGNDNRDRMFSWEGPFMVEVVPTILP